MSRPILSRQLAKWSLLLQKFEFIYITQWVIKDQTSVDFLIDHPIIVNWELIETLSPWQMFYDGATHREGVGVRVVFITSKGDILAYSFTLIEKCSNNVAKYRALILGLEIAMDAKRRHIKVFGDLKLIINKFLGIYEVTNQS